ncbi:MAG TPA: futalosine hydrolase [Jatrophihabitans sp.]|uniref:futalosine hydrolase n=1 Tax=Jatrophihabitans sp. TaxID=1932789 RepID=UPI002E053451|nr:futalosine hydrolase [Jatrophihabitans sp.]
MRLLVVTAVDAERDAVVAGLPAGATVSVIAGGVGPAAAAASAAAALAGGGFDLALSAGIGGGFAPLVPGDIAVASAIVFADLGAESDGGFVPVSELGFGGERYDVPARLAVELTDRTGGHLGTVLTVATVTGSAERASALAGRFPDAVAEGMEGAGVAAAARLHDVAFGEVRAISNAVGPRDRAAWEIPAALAALARAVAAIVGAESMS